MVDNSFSTVQYGQYHRIRQIVVNIGNPESDEIKNKFKLKFVKKDLFEFFLAHFDDFYQIVDNLSMIIISFGKNQ